MTTGKITLAVSCHVKSKRKIIHTVGPRGRETTRQRKRRRGCTALDWRVTHEISKSTMINKDYNHYFFVLNIIHLIYPDRQCFVVIANVMLD